MSKEDVFRVKVYEEAPEMLWVAGCAVQWLGSEEPSSRGASSSQQKKEEVGDQTHKHRVIWLCPNDIVTKAIWQHWPAQSKQRSCVTVADAASALWKEGSLHYCLASAPRKEWCQRMTITPESPSAGEFVGVMLPWCGDNRRCHAPVVR